MRFADYFARAFSGVSSAQFPWVKLFRESPVAKLSEVRFLSLLIYVVATLAIFSAILNFNIILILLFRAFVIGNDLLLEYMLFGLELV